MKTLCKSLLDPSVLENELSAKHNNCSQLFLYLAGDASII